MKILIAPNSFKECGSANEISDVLSKALKKYGFNNLVRFPISDGGDGFLDVCKENFNLKVRTHEVESCFTDSKIKVRVGKGKTSNRIYLEVADFIGLRTIPINKRNPTKINSQNLGIFLKKIITQQWKQRNSYPKITIGIGGTGISDLGLGLCVPFGLKLYDKENRELKAVPENYNIVKKIILPGKMNLIIDVILDVKARLFGKNGTSMVFARQKGASDEEIKALEKGVKNILNILRHKHKIDFSKELIGAGGGLSLGLSLISKVNVITSRKFLIEKLKLRKKIKSVDAVISGEGKIDNQSYLEKATGIVISESIKQNKKLYLIVGINALKGESNKQLKIYSLVDYFGSVTKSINEYKKGINSILKFIVTQIK